MKDMNCAYCAEGDLLAAFGIKICDLDHSTLILFKEQSHPGRVIVAYKDHIGEIADLSDEAMFGFMKDVKKAAQALHGAFKPNKINYGAYGDTGCHLHFHLVPKYKDGFEWASTFAMNPQAQYLEEVEYQAMIGRILDHLK